MSTRGDRISYRSIAESLAEEIRSGRWEPGAKLPPHRQLAERLGVAVATVTRAYAELARIGLAEGQHGRGTFARRHPQRRKPQAISEWKPGGTIDLSLNPPAIAPLHAVALAEAFHRFQSADELASLLEYGPSVGAPRHREAAADWLGGRRCLVSPSQIQICNGVQHALAVSFGCLFRPGDTVITEWLTNPSIKALANFLRLRLVAAPMDEHGLDPDALAEVAREAGARGLYCMPNLQNPSATVMPSGRRQRIVEVAARLGLSIVENDIYGPLLDDPSPPMSTLAPERCHYVTGFSKTVAAGLRIAYLVAPPTINAHVAGAIFATNTLASPLMASVATYWIESGWAARLLAWQRAEASARRAIARDALDGGDVPQIPCNHLWLPLPEPWRADQVLALAKERGLLLTPPETFVVGRAASPHAVRIGLGAASSRAALRRGLDILAKLLASEQMPPPALL